MLKQQINNPGPGQADKALTDRTQLSVEIAEISEIAEMLFGKIEDRMKALVGVEQRLDSKIALLEELIQRLEKAAQSYGSGGDKQYRDITELSARGLKIDDIAGLLDIPRGEVELILRLRK
jgi:DNA-binding transcriptional MerR regulator